jgi:oligosaccharide translocation protein RFT1
MPSSQTMVFVDDVFTDKGSLIARVLFQPIEETLRTVLSKLLTIPNKENLLKSSVFLTTLLKLYVLLALLMFSVISPFIPSLVLPVLRVLIGKSGFQSEALLPVLYVYIYYIPIMAVNGVTESFVASVATTGDLVRQSRAMILFSLLFLGASWGFIGVLDMAGQGLVWANCLNLGVRIVWSCIFIQNWFSLHKSTVGWRLILPSRGTLVMSILVGLSVRWINGKALYTWFETIGIVGLSGMILSTSMYVRFDSSRSLQCFL